MNTNFAGRVRNTDLPISHSLMPVFEGVVNSVQSLGERKISDPPGLITVALVRERTLPLQQGKRGAPTVDAISDIEITDNGVGFDAENFKSFETLDTDYKAKYRCRGVGRLLWLKAFERVEVESIFADGDGPTRRRTFKFSSDLGGVGDVAVHGADGENIRTTVRLHGFMKPYQQNARKSLRVIAEDLLEHCLFYFVRPAPGHHPMQWAGNNRLHMREITRWGSLIQADS